MNFGYSETCLEHDPGPRHPETADRLRAIREGLSRKHGVEYVESDPATTGAIEAVHDAGYVAELEEFCASGGGDWDPDTTAVEGTWAAARQSAGLARWAAAAALDGADGRDTPFSIGRPPGHHAVGDDAMGFCFVNNVAVAAQGAIDGDYGGAPTAAGDVADREGSGDGGVPAVDRVAIIDWDVHHGNGTQDLFYDRGDVLFCSLHERGIYPGTGDAEETGEGDGEGTTLNVPLAAGAGTAEYVAVLSELVAPAIDEFGPDLVLVSAGFDAHRHDPISRMRVTTEGYGLLAERVRSIADDAGAPLAFVLEGGYALDVLADSVGTVHEVFDGYEPAGPDEDVDEAVADLIDDVRSSHPLL